VTKEEYGTIEQALARGCYIDWRLPVEIDWKEIVQNAKTSTTGTIARDQSMGIVFDAEPS